MNSGSIVYLVDDDDALRLATSAMLKVENFMVSAYPTAEEFLADINSSASGCLITDLLLPGMSGIELQQVLIERNIKLPVIFMTGYGDINESVQAMKAGAVDFVEKPVAPEALIRRIREALRLDNSHREMESEDLAIIDRFNELTPREREVIALVAEGKTNKVIARDLEISFRTVEKHRASAMQKLDADNAVELARIVQQYMSDKN